MDKQLDSYIKENLAKGIIKDEIKKQLLAAGWKEEDIDNAFLRLETRINTKISINNSGQTKSRSNFLSRTIMLLAFTIVSAIIFGAISVRNLAIVGLLICGDVSCSSIQSVVIIMIITSYLVTFATPGVFLFSIRYNHWKLPLLPIIVSILPLAIGIIASVLNGVTNPFLNIVGSISFSGVFQTFLSGPIWSVLMFLIYLASLIATSRFIHGLSNLSHSKKAKIFLSLELLFFIVVIGISSFAPKTFQKVERATNPAVKTTSLPLGKIYYYANSYLKIEGSIESIDSAGNKKGFPVPTQCEQAMISWDQNYIFCFTLTNEAWIVNTVTSKSTKINPENGFPLGQYAWSPDSHYLLLSSSSGANLSDLNRLDVNNLKIEKLNKVPLNGIVSKAIYSPNNQLIAFEVDVHTFNYNYTRQLKIYDLNSQQFYDIGRGPQCDGTNDCEIKNLQFSSDSSHLFYASNTLNMTNVSQSDYLDKLVLVNLSNQDAKEYAKKYSSNIVGFLDILSIYDGLDSFVYLDPNERKSVLKKVNILDGKEQHFMVNNGNAISSEGSYLAFNGDWILYTSLEAGNYVTYVEKLATGERFRIFNDHEYALALSFRSYRYLYWFK